MKFPRAIPMLVMAAALVCRANAAGAESTESGNSLGDYAGVYAYRDGATVCIVPKKGRLIAVLDEAPYPLTRVDGDAFKNGAGQPVTFRRGPGGAIAGVVEVTNYFPRLSKEVPPEILRLTISRPASDPDYRYRIPVKLDDGMGVGAGARAAGFDEAVLQQLGRDIVAEKYPHVHSVLLWRNGKLVFEEYFYGYDVDRPHQMRSATKSFIATLVGTAVDQGKIRTARQPIIELLPWPIESFAHPDPRKARITVDDLLTMRSGLDCDDRDADSLGNDNVVYRQPDWARYAMDLPMVADPGVVARYCSAGPYLAGRMLEHVTGRDLLEYADSTLFKPMGFRNYRWPHQTVSSNVATFGQLYLRPRDFLKFGILYINCGRWQGKQLVSREWIERSTQPLSKIGSKTYGYFWWQQSFSIKTGSQVSTVDTWLATGNGGQKLFVAPSLGLIAVFTGGNYNSTVDTPPNEIMANVVLPQLLRTAPGAER
jgi:CubicO group peptidase (beta-lactamase class C family)